MPLSLDNEFGRPVTHTMAVMWCRVTCRARKARGARLDVPQHARTHLPPPETQSHYHRADGNLYCTTGKQDLYRRSGGVPCLACACYPDHCYLRHLAELYRSSSSSSTTHSTVATAEAPDAKVRATLAFTGKLRAAGTQLNLSKRPGVLPPLPAGERGTSTSTQGVTRQAPDLTRRMPL